MPSVFKALASISAWVLFLFGWWNILGATWGYFVSGPIGSTPVTYNILGIWALGAACFILSVVAMRLRQKME